MLTCYFLGNACIEIISDTDHIIIDPIFLVPPQKGIEKILITHHHADHINLDKLAEIDQKHSIKGRKSEIYAPKCVQEEFNIGFNLVEPGSKIVLNDGIVKVYENNCWKAEGCVAFLITIGGKNILHTADAASYSEQLRAIKDTIDICFVACFESNFEDYLEFLKIIKPKLAIPFHYTAEKEDDAKKLMNFLEKNNVDSRLLAIGEALNF